MKLLFIANSRVPTERAMGTAIMKQCEAFARYGLDVELIVPQRHNEHTEDPFLYHDVEHNFQITYLRSLDLSLLQKSSVRTLLQRITFFISMCVYIWKSDADILYGREPEFIGHIPTRKKKFVELHHLYGLRFFGRKTLQSLSGIITITHALKEDVVHRFGVEVSKIYVAPSGVDLSHFECVTNKDGARTRLGIHTTKPVAMYIGALEEWKGYKTFLDAAKFLNDEVTFVVIGGSDDQVKKLQRAYAKVHFLGTRSQRDLANNQQAADVLVVPNSAKEEISARHTSPLKVVAHMASGIPIVASSTVSIREILNEHNAFLVEPDNAKLLADAIFKILKEKKNSVTIAERAKIDVQKYDWKYRTGRIVTFLHEYTTEINK